MRQFASILFLVASLCGCGQGRAQEAVVESLVDTLPTPTTPTLYSSGCLLSSVHISLSAAATHCSTPRALHPAALATLMPLALHHARSIWSVPIVAVAMNLTRELANRASSQRVRVRTMRASQSLTRRRLISLPAQYTTSAYGSKTPFMKGMALSMISFMVSLNRGCSINLAQRYVKNRKITIFA